MESRVEKAVQLFAGGMNCAQAVACAYCDVVGVDETAMLEMTQAFGAGMGTMDGACGALVGAGVILGLAKKDRRATTSGMRGIVTAFKERNGAVTCKVLKGVETGTVLRRCPDCVRDAAELLEKALGDM